MKTHYVLFAKRLGGTVTQLCKDYDQWVEKSQEMLDNGFMVSIGLDENDPMWSVLDSNGQVVFIRESGMNRGAGAWLL